MHDTFRAHQASPTFNGQHSRRQHHPGISHAFVHRSLSLRNFDSKRQAATIETSVHAGLPTAWKMRASHFSISSARPDRPPATAFLKMSAAIYVRDHISTNPSSWQVFGACFAAWVFAKRQDLYLVVRGGAAANGGAQRRATSNQPNPRPAHRYSQIVPWMPSTPFKQEKHPALLNCRSISHSI